DGALVEDGDGGHVMDNGRAGRGVYAVGETTAAFHAEAAIVAGSGDGKAAKRDAKRRDGGAGWRFRVHPPRLDVRLDAFSAQFAADLDQEMVEGSCFERLSHGIDGIAFGYAGEVERDRGEAAGAEIIHLYGLPGRVGGRSCRHSAS